MDKLIWHTEQRKIKDLIPYKFNPRKMTETQVKYLTDSLEKFGLVEIPAIDIDNTLIAGHQRMKIESIRGKGEDIIDVRVPNRKLTEEEFKEYNLRSNQNRGMFDYELLGSLFDEQKLIEIGFSEFDLGLQFPNNPNAEWTGMPEFSQDDKTSFRAIIVHFKNQEDINDFANKINQKLTDKTRAIWYPEVLPGTFTDKRYVSE